MSSYTLEIIGSIAQAQKEFAKIPGFTESAAAKAAMAWAKNQEKMRREAEKTANKIAKEMDGASQDAGKSLDALKTIGEKSIGGIVGDLADMAGALGALGPAGMLAVGGLLAIGGAAVGIAATVTAVIELERAALDYVAALEEVDAIDLVTDAQKQQVVEANAALDALGMVAKSLAVVLAAELGPAIADTAIFLADIGLQFLDVANAVFRTHSLLESLAIAFVDTFARSLIQPIEMMMRFHQALALVEQSLGVTDGVNSKIYASYERLVGGIGRTVTGFDGLKDSATETNGEMSRGERLAAELASKLSASSAATHGAASAHRQAADGARQHAAATASLLGIIAESGADQLTDFQRETAEIESAYQRRVDAATEAYNKSAQAAQDFALLEQALSEAAARRDRDRTDAELADLERRTQAELSALAVVEQAKADERAREQAALDEAATRQAERDASTAAAMEALQARFTQLLFDRISMVHDTMAEERQANIAALEERLANDEHLTAAKRQELQTRLDSERNALTATARAQRAVTAFQILLQGALAMIQAVAVAPPPFNAATIAAQAALVALNTAAALAAPLPKFHSGSGRMAPDETPAIIRRGEAVLSERAVQELNRGNMGVLNQPQVQQVYWNGRLMSEVMGMAFATPGPARRFVEARMPTGRGYRG